MHLEYLSLAKLVSGQYLKVQRLGLGNTSEDRGVGMRHSDTLVMRWCKNLGRLHRQVRSQACWIVPASLLTLELLIGTCLNSSAAPGPCVFWDSDCVVGHSIEKHQDPERDGWPSGVRWVFGAWGQACICASPPPHAPPLPRRAGEVPVLPTVT